MLNYDVHCFLHNNRDRTLKRHVLNVLICHLISSSGIRQAHSALNHQLSTTANLLFRNYNASIHLSHKNSSPDSRYSARSRRSGYKLPWELKLHLCCSYIGARYKQACRQPSTPVMGMTITRTVVSPLPLSTFSLASAFLVPEPSSPHPISPPRSNWQGNTEQATCSRILGAGWVCIFY